MCEQEAGRKAGGRELFERCLGEIGGVWENGCEVRTERKECMTDMPCEPRECKSVRGVNGREGQTVREGSMEEREGCMTEVSLCVCVWGVNLCD